MKSENIDKWVILASVCLAALVLPLDFSGVAIATPAIVHDLGGGPVAANWVVNAFMLSFGSLLLGAGALADALGRKRVFVAGISFFAAVSLAIGFSPNIATLDFLRAAQGIAAAATLAGGSAALAQEFEEIARARAFSLLGTTFGLGLAFGPSLAGLLIDAHGWRSIFWTSTLMALIAFVFGAPRMRESRNPRAGAIDWPGLISFTSALVFFTFGVLEGPSAGWGSRLTIALFGGAFISAASFVAIEKRVPHPILDLSLFRFPKFVGVQFLPVATCYSYVVLLVLLPSRFIGIEGQSEFDTGEMMIAISACMLFVPFLAASMTRWISPGLISSAGLVIAALGLLWLGQVPPRASHLSFILPMLVIGLGASMPWGLMDGLSVSVVPKERAGMATGIFSTTRVAGEGIALAITRALLSVITQAKMARLSPTPLLAREAGQQLAAGELTRANLLLPHADASLLLRIYGESFQLLAYGLSAITLLSAAIIFYLLARTPEEGFAIGSRLPLKSLNPARREPGF